MFFFSLGFELGRYLLIAGGAYVLFWILFKARLQTKRIQKRDFNSADLRREFSNSIVTSVLFAIIFGALIFFAEDLASRVYHDPFEYGVAWLLLAPLALVLIHNTYFYWLHRILHLPRVYRWAHRAHHQSVNPSPLAAFSFHPLEAFLEIAWIIPLVLLVPLHPLSLLAFSTVALVQNVMGHLGVELLPESWRRHRVLRYLNRSTWHNSHHRVGRGNYGYYFTFWDRCMGTFDDRDR